MSIASLTDALQWAERRNCAVGAFNVWNWESAMAIIEGAEEEGVPVIAMVYAGVLERMGLEESVSFLRAAAQKAAVPVVIHLDHSSDEHKAIQCAAAGFSSVMYDGSQLPFDENLDKTKELVEKASILDCDVEGELGQVGSAATDDYFDPAAMTVPGDAAEFAARSGVTALAVAIGNAHGLYREEPHLDFPRLEEIRNRSGVPLVLHGGTGIPDSDIRRAIALGVRKINVGTEIVLAMQRAFAEQMRGSPDGWNFLEASTAARKEVKTVVRNRISLFAMK